MPACRRVTQTCIYRSWFRCITAACCSEKCHEREAVRRRSKTRWLLMSCQITAVLWQQMGTEGDVGHLDVISILFLRPCPHRRQMHHLSSELMAVVLWTVTRTVHLLHTSAHMHRNIQTNIPLKLLPPLQPPHPPKKPPPTPEPLVMQTRCFYSPRTEGSGSAAQVKAPTPLLTADAL